MRRWVLVLLVLGMFGGAILAAISGGQNSFLLFQIGAWLALVCTLALILLCIGGAVWGNRRIAQLRQREKENRCLQCGYSREGLAPDVACPECGYIRRTTTKKTRRRATDDLWWWMMG